MFCILYAVQAVRQTGKRGKRVRGGREGKAIEHIELGCMFIYINAMLHNANSCNIGTPALQALRNQ